METVSTSITSQLLLCAIVSLSAYTLYVYYRFYKRWSSLPTFKANSLFSYCKMIKNFDSIPSVPALCYVYQLLTGFSRIVKDGICLYWIFFTPYVLVYDPKLVKELICHPDAQEKPYVYKFMSPIIGQGLVTSNGDHWANHRKLISPAFHLELLKDYISIFNEQAEILITKLKDTIGKPWIDIVHYVDACSFDIITESTLGIKMGCQNGNKLATAFVKAIDDGEDIAVHRFSRPWTRNGFLFSFFPLGKILLKSKKIVYELSNKVIQENKERLLLKKKNEAEGKETVSGTNKKKSSFLERLLLCHFENPSFTTDDIRDELITMIAAGHESTALTLSWALYLVGLNPDVQEKIFLELDSIFLDDSNEKVSYDQLKDMNYLTGVIKEALRVYPTVPILARRVRAEIKVEKYSIPEESVILFILDGMYKNPEVYPDPEVFKPERFLPENAKNIHQFSLLPFSAGSRNCLGQKFAMMEMKITLAHIFRNFKVESLDQRDKLNTLWGITLKNVQPLRIRFFPRH